MSKELIYVVEQGGFSNAKNKIANEKDKIVQPDNFQFVKIDELNQKQIQKSDLIILEDEAKNQLQLIKASSEISEIKKIIICDNLDVFSLIIKLLQDAPKIITLDYKIGAVKTTEKLPSIYSKIKEKFGKTSVVGYTNYALIKKDDQFSESSADALTKLIRENGDSVLSKSAMNEKSLEAVLYDRLQIYQYRIKYGSVLVELDELKSEKKIDSSIVDRLLKDYKESPKFAMLFPPLIGNSRAIRKIKYFIEAFSKDDSTIFISGESGTGKELVARAIHLLGNRSGEPFIDISPAIPEGLIESELFGHEEGAFTNATKKRIGKFELANKGVLFLDEIGDYSLNVQAKILRAIQEKTIVRVGGKENIRVDVKLITATNQNLKKLVSKNEFRGDLLYRINSTFPKLPPLRERKEDIPLLIQYFLNASRSDMHFSADSIKYLTGLEWEGNVRELKKVVEQSSTLFSTKSVKVIEKDEVQLIIQMLEKDDETNEDKLKSLQGEMECSEVANFLDEINLLLKTNEKYLDVSKINLDDLASDMGLSRNSFYEKRLKFTPCIEKLLAEIPERWEVILSKKVKLTSKPQSKK